MKYSKEERLEIGRRIYEGEITTAMAAEEYDINFYTAREYLRTYKASIHVAVPKEHRKYGNADETLKKHEDEMRKYDGMTRDELIDEIILAKINEARAKKGYEVKGGGRHKEYKALDKKNSK